MSRISKAFESKRAFVGYLTVGDATIDRFFDLIERGVNVIEVGLPFSDPVADGPVIQQAMQRALEKKTKKEKALEIIAALREKSEVAIVVFTYFNPIQKDLAGFLQKIKEAGADGILVVDLPIEHAQEYEALCSKIGLDPIFIISASTEPSRIQTIAQHAKGFLYYACRKGVTGAREDLPEDLSQRIALIRTMSSLPIAVGFGISSIAMGEKVLDVADGFVIGSQFVKEGVL